MEISAKLEYQIDTKFKSYRLKFNKMFIYTFNPNVKPKQTYIYIQSIYMPNIYRISMWRLQIMSTLFKSLYI